MPNGLKVDPDTNPPYNTDIVSNVAASDMYTTIDADRMTIRSSTTMYYSIVDPAIAHITSLDDMRSCFADLDISDLMTQVASVPSGFGGYADVFRGSMTTALGSVAVAVKQLRLATPSSVVLQKIGREIALWNTLEHPNILPFIGLSWSASSMPAMVSPWLTNGNIIEYLATRRTEPNALSLTTRLLCDVLHGVVYLHDLALTHGDLKGANILVSDDGIACVADFGISAVLAEFPARTASATGTHRWTAPDLFHEHGGLTREADIWSCGCTILEVVSGELPFYTIAYDRQVIIALGNNTPPPRPTVMPEDVWRVCQACFTITPTARPTAVKLLSELQLLNVTYTPGLPIAGPSLPHAGSSRQRVVTLLEPLRVIGTHHDDQSSTPQTQADAPPDFAMFKQVTPPERQRRAVIVACGYNEGARCRSIEELHEGVARPSRVAAAAVDKSLLVPIPVIRNNATGEYLVPLLRAHTDAHNLQTMLKRTFQFRDENIELLIDAGDPQARTSTWPTRTNILSTIKRLVKDAPAGSSLVFAFTGHGARQKNLDGKEENVFDELLITADGENIVDNELNALLVKAVPDGCMLTALIDCSHSGVTAMNTKYTFRVDDQKRVVPYNLGLRRFLYSDFGRARVKWLREKEVLPTPAHRVCIFSVYRDDGTAMGSMNGLTLVDLVVRIVSRRGKMTSKELLIALDREFQKISEWHYRRVKVPYRPQHPQYGTEDVVEALDYPFIEYRRPPNAGRTQSAPAVSTRSRIFTEMRSEQNSTSVKP